MKKSQQVAVCAVMVALAMALSYAEHWIPLQAVIPLPGVKLGLANIVTLAALYCMGWKQAFLILITRCILGAAFGGGVSAFLFSIVGGLLAMMTMALVKKTHFFSVYGVSVLGAAAHQIGQILVAMVVMQSWMIAAYLVYLLIIAAVTGLVTGTITANILKVLKKVRLLPVMMALCLMMTGCSGVNIAATTQAAQGKTIYSKTYYDVFDTVTIIKGAETSEEVFLQKAEEIHETLLFYHELFDIYNEYEGVVNMKVVNEKAGTEAVEVSAELLKFLQVCQEDYELTDGTVNVALGTVLKLWHEAREAALSDESAGGTNADSDEEGGDPEEFSGGLPTMAALKAAAEHTDMKDVIIDAEASTVRFADPLLKLDVGAVAKGYAAEKAAKNAPEGYLLSVGGNICATGAKDENGTPWKVGIQDPKDLNAYMEVVELTGGSVVTSGDYQRYFEVDGVRYHHIIDPSTLMPADKYCSVSVKCEDSGLGDALSTALFILPLDEGKALAEKCGAEVLWITVDGEEIRTAGW